MRQGISSSSLKTGCPPIPLPKSVENRFASLSASRPRLWASVKFSFAQAQWETKLGLNYLHG